MKNYAQQHLTKHRADCAFRKVCSSWLSLSQADKESLRKARRFLGADR
jgi:hypothetical protein